MREPGSSAEMTYLAPGAVDSGSMRLPAADEPSWPDPEDHLVEPGTRYEVFDGERVHVSPARPGHGDLHSQLDKVIAHHAASEYTASTDLLTRRSKANDFATDTSVRRAGINPATGRRYLEELSFEIFFQQSYEHTRTRARKVVAHGVRRMFGIFVKERWPGSDEAGEVDCTVAEWSAERDDWSILAANAVIQDPALSLPVPVEALIDAAASDNAAARALLARSNPVLKAHDAKVRSEGHGEGRLSATRENLFEILAHRKIVLDAAQRARIEACNDLATLKRWLLRATDARDAAELLA
jgi:hypothetical protein